MELTLHPTFYTHLGCLSHQFHDANRLFRMLEEYFVHFSSCRRKTHLMQLPFKTSRQCELASDNLTLFQRRTAAEFAQFQAVSLFTKPFNLAALSLTVAVVRFGLLKQTKIVGLRDLHFQLVFRKLLDLSAICSSSRYAIPACLLDVRAAFTVIVAPAHLYHCHLVAGVCTYYIYLQKSQYSDSGQVKFGEVLRPLFPPYAFQSSSVAHTFP